MRKQTFYSTDGTSLGRMRVFYYIYERKMLMNAARVPVQWQYKLVMECHMHSGAYNEE